MEETGEGEVVGERKIGDRRKMWEKGSGEEGDYCRETIVHWFNPSEAGGHARPRTSDRDCSQKHGEDG
ncbi:hypothetical protein VNO80_04497 [Phaseolus coccineus]|uniref:Uncharacterized protein n=1 Tax=Phaseolus coccineus TaxID=3886 RepID=A0AAN9NV06_PHACN